MTQRNDPKDSDARGEILARLTSAYEGQPLDVPVTPAYVRTAPPDEPGERLKLLLERFEEGRIGYHLVSGRDELLDSLANRLYARKTRLVALGDDPLLAELKVAEGLAERLLETQLAPTATATPESLREADVGVTGAQALLAQTGTVAVRGKTPGSLAASLVPGVHYCVATLAQLHDSLEAWLAREPLDAAWHHVLISGPSRTADIEKRIVIGVHGPWKVSVFLLR